MNKKLVAVAVAGMLAAPLAAQAQTANVTLYGRLNVDYELVNGKQTDGSNPWVSRLSRTRRVSASVARNRWAAV